jgi:hypothetical protein
MVGCVTDSGHNNYKSAMDLLAHYDGSPFYRAAGSERATAKLHDYHKKRLLSY